jgi:hypothetical protein
MPKEIIKMTEEAKRLVEVLLSNPLARHGTASMAISEVIARSMHPVQSEEDIEDAVCSLVGVTVEVSGNNGFAKFTVLDWAQCLDGVVGYRFNDQFLQHTGADHQK